MRGTLFVVLITVFSSLAQAQFWLIESGSKDANKAVIADVTATLTAQTPWGPVTVSVENGKYWRSKTDQLRVDDSHGHSTFHHPNPTTPFARADNELRVLMVDADMAFHFPEKPQVRGGWEDQLFASIANSPRPKTLTKASGVFEGQKVKIRAGEFQGWRYEIWTSDSLHMVLRAKYSTATTQFDQYFHNIRLEEPDESVFSLPSGFTMLVSCVGNLSSKNAQSHDGGRWYSPIYHSSVEDCK